MSPFVSHVSYSESCLLLWVMSPVVSHVSSSESCMYKMYHLYDWHFQNSCSMLHTDVLRVHSCPMCLYKRHDSWIHVPYYTLTCREFTHVPCYTRPRIFDSGGTSQQPPPPPPPHPHVAVPPPPPQVMVSSSKGIGLHGLFNKNTMPPLYIGIYLMSHVSYIDTCHMSHVMSFT